MVKAGRFKSMFWDWLMAEHNISEASTAPRYVTCPCQYCGGKIEFDANELDTAESTTVRCPHRGLETIIFEPKQQGVPPIISPAEPPEEFPLGVAFLQQGNYSEAVKYFAEAAKQGHPDAQNNLGLCYANGQGVPKDMVEAVKWYRKAAEQHCALAQCRLGVCYAEGNGVAKNEVEAVKWYRRAAEENFADAQCMLGTCYINGQGVTEDHNEGVKWWLKAAEQGSAVGAFCLGSAYQQGGGVTKDESEAIKWYRKAAEQNLALAQDRLSDSYERVQDYIEAYKWAKLAAGQGYEGAQKKCENLVLKMNAAQIGAVEPSERITWRNERLTPKQFSDFIGQERLKSRLELATAAAKKRQEAVDHILLVGPLGSGKATLAHIFARAMGANLKTTSGPTIEKAGDLAGLLTNLEEGDMLFIDEIHRLRRYIVEYLCPAMKDSKLDIIIDQGPNAQSVRLNLPRFTLIGTTPRKEPLTTALLSCFPIIEKMDAYSVEELAALACRFAKSVEIEIDAETAERVARSADGTPLDVLNRLRHVRDYAHIKANGKITAAIALEALKMLIAADETNEAGEDRTAIPSEVRREVWRRDGGRCARCGSRERLEYDHIIPVTKGGSNTARNIELLCETCNRAKSDLIR